MHLAGDTESIKRSAKCDNIPFVGINLGYNERRKFGVHLFYKRSFFFVHDELHRIAHMQSCHSAYRRVTLRDITAMNVLIIFFNVCHYF